MAVFAVLEEGAGDVDRDIDLLFRLVLLLSTLSLDLRLEFLCLSSAEESRDTLDVSASTSERSEERRLLLRLDLVVAVVVDSSPFLKLSSPFFFVSSSDSLSCGRKRCDKITIAITNQTQNNGNGNT